MAYVYDPPRGAGGTHVGLSAFPSQASHWYVVRKTTTRIPGCKHYAIGTDIHG